MVCFGIFGYLIRKFDYEGAPFLLGMVLGPMFETAFRQSLIYGDPLIFFRRPITAVLLGVSIFLLITPFFPTIRLKRKELEKTLEDDLQ
jgi:putative tricarboxylic transport membrane protein